MEWSCETINLGFNSRAADERRNPTSFLSIVY
jgi:hypothetical protein